MNDVTKRLVWSGLLAGLGALAIPGLGPIVAAGWLVAARSSVFAALCRSMIASTSAERLSSVRTVTRLPPRRTPSA